MPDDQIPPLAERPTNAVSKRMKRTRRQDTSAEMAIRSEAHARGLRYRVHRRPIAAVRSKADMVFIGARVAVYVNGCFWHGCPEHATWPKKNADYWRAKIEANMERDERVNRDLRDAGWRVLRIWECEDPAEAVDRLEQVLSG